MLTQTATESRMTQKPKENPVSVKCVYFALNGSLVEKEFDIKNNAHRDRIQKIIYWCAKNKVELRIRPL